MRSTSRALQDDISTGGDISVTTLSAIDRENARKRAVVVEGDGLADITTTGQSGIERHRAHQRAPRSARRDAGRRRNRRSRRSRRARR